MNRTTNPRKTLGIFSLAMITAGSVDSLRNLPATALFGSSLIFFFFLAAILFLLPSALISAELSSSLKTRGGIYAWVKEAFGVQFGFLAIWFQWIENVIWYPAILSFVAGTIGYLISPTLAQSKVFLVTVILCSFWGATIINLLGIKSSARFSNFAALSGLLLPMTLIIALGAVWLFSGKPLQITFTEHSLLPHFHNSHLWVALTGIILSFCGMEIATVHTSDVNNPQHSYPRAMLLATLIIVSTLVLGSLAIAAVISTQNISLVAGIMQAFHAFFAAYHLQWLLPLIALMLVIGGMGSVSNWIIAPTRGLLIAGEDGNLPQHLLRKNKTNAPSTLLIYQAIIVSIVTMAFLLMPSVNGSYWLLTALAAQLYMIMYLFMFISAIRLRYKATARQSGFLIPGGNVGMWIIALLGCIGASLTFIIGFIPPSNIQIGSDWHYDMLLLAGLIVMSAPPFILHRRRRENIENSEPLTLSTETN